jgi:hypothetical protein
MAVLIGYFTFLFVSNELGLQAQIGKNQTK